MTVPTPVSTASFSARIRCTQTRASVPVTHRLSPFDSATLPSSEAAHFTVTHGRPCDIRLIKPLFIHLHSFSSTPLFTSMPAALSFSSPRPATRGFGSVIPATTRFGLCSTSISEQGGVLP